MPTDNSAWIADLANRFPGGEPDAIGASAGDVRRLIDHLAGTNDLTLAEAAEAIEEWQAGLSLPAGPQAHSLT